MRHASKYDIIHVDMNARFWGFLACLTGWVAVAHSASLLQAQSFPKTFNDLSFTDRMAVRAEGYAPFETEYDEQGRCISGCPYAGMTIEDEEQAVARLTDQVHRDLAAYRAQRVAAARAAMGAQVTDAQTADTTQKPDTSNVSNAQSDVSVPSIPSLPNLPKIIAGAEQESPQVLTPTYVPQQPSAPDTEQQDTEQDDQEPEQDAPAATRTCNPCVASTPVGNPLPTGCPLAANPMIITSPFTTSRYHPTKHVYKSHLGVDLRAAMGTDVFATAAGVVSYVGNEPNGCGTYVKILHDSNYATTYCHLSQALVSTGEQVEAGCRIGLSGNTGASSAPHLHYAITPNAAQGNKVAIDPTTMIEYCTFKNK